MRSERPRPERATSEDALVARLRAGDEASFVELVTSLHASLVRVALAFVRDEAAAEEVAQDTWVGVLKGLPAFGQRSSIKTWIFQILVNRARTRGQRDRRMLTFSEAGGDDDDGGVSADRFTSRGGWAQPLFTWHERGPQEALLNQETAGLLQNAIALLPPNQGAVLTLHDVEGLASREVCNVLSISETNQRVLLHRARTRLRAAVERHLSRHRAGNTSC